MDEKSTDPHKFPINKSSPSNQMRALLTKDFIKIVFSDEPLLDYKENFLSKDASSSSSSSSNTENISKAPKVIEDKSSPKVRKDFQSYNEQNSEFKQTSRQVFMPTICHVSFCSHFPQLSYIFHRSRFAKSTSVDICYATAVK